MSENTYFDWGNLFNFLRLMGLAPYERTETGNYNVSKKFQLYSFTIAFLVSLFFYFDDGIIKGYLDGENLLSIAFLLLNVLGYTFASVFCILATVYNVTQFSFLINKIIELNKDLDKSPILRTKNRYGFKLYLYCICQGFLFITNNIIYIISEKNRNLVYYFTCILTSLTGQAFVATDINFVIFVNNSFIIFKKINCVLYLKKNLSNLKTLRKTCSKACDINDLINKCFSEMLLVLVTTEFSALVFLVYFKNKHDSRGFTAVPIFWLLTYFLKLFIKIESGRSVKSEVKYLYIIQLNK